MRRVLGILGAAVAIVAVASAGTAAAHVTIQPGEANQGGFATLFVQVPNEKDDAGTVKVEVTMPVDHPIANVSFEPVPGWTITPERSTLPKPITVHGEEVTEAVTKITFEGGPVAPGQFVRFPVSMGPMPEGVDQLTFPTVQTYSDGDVVRWIETGEDAEHPAPTVALVVDETGGHDKTATPDDEVAITADDSHDESSSSDDTLAIVAIVVGGVGVLLALVALLRKGRTTA